MLQFPKKKKFKPLFYCVPFYVFWGQFVLKLRVQPSIKVWFLSQRLVKFQLVAFTSAGFFRRCREAASSRHAEPHQNPALHARPGAVPAAPGPHRGRQRAGRRDAGAAASLSCFMRITFLLFLTNSDDPKHKRNERSSSSCVSIRMHVCVAFSHGSVQFNCALLLPL